MPTKEERFVVNPLATFLLNRKRSGAGWSIKDRPKYGKSARGWDLQAERKNQVLLIEAKYIVGPFASAMAGLTLAPLSDRRERMRSGRKLGSWCAAVAWAIGWDGRNYTRDGIYQIVLDYLSRNPGFWRCYSRELKVKYIFFVENGSVARISFDKILTLAKRYAPFSGATRAQRRTSAQNLMSLLVYSPPNS